MFDKLMKIGYLLLGITALVVLWQHGRYQPVSHRSGEVTMLDTRTGKLSVYEVEVHWDYRSKNPWVTIVRVPER